MKEVGRVGVERQPERSGPRSWPCEKQERHFPRSLGSWSWDGPLTPTAALSERSTPRTQINGGSWLTAKKHGWISSNKGSGRGTHLMRPRSNAACEACPTFEKPSTSEFGRSQRGLLSL